MILWLHDCTQDLACFRALTICLLSSLLNYLLNLNVWNTGKLIINMKMDAACKEALLHLEADRLIYDSFSRRCTCSCMWFCFCFIVTHLCWQDFIESYRPTIWFGLEIMVWVSWALLWACVHMLLYAQMDMNICVQNVSVLSAPINRMSFGSPITHMIYIWGQKKLLPHPAVCQNAQGEILRTAE